MTWCSVKLLEAERPRVILDIFPLNPTTYDRLKPVYEAFSKVAKVEYAWPLSAIEFDGLTRALDAGLLKGSVFWDVLNDRGAGFMLYQVEPHGSLEIKVLYLHPDIDVKMALDTIFRRFLEDAAKLPGWSVISYPMLGPAQLRYIRFTNWYGFTPIGQAVTKFHLLDPLSAEIFGKLDFAPLPDGYQFVAWDAKYQDAVAEVLSEAFKESADARWDPRFRTLEGMKEALQFVQSGGYGRFSPEYTTVLLNDQQQPVGACLLNIVSPIEANIPLIGLKESERKHKLGRTLLAQTVKKCLDDTLKGKVGLAYVTATVATSNIPAVKMYRHTGFQEDYWYPHIYQTCETLNSRKPGQWC